MESQNSYDSFEEEQKQSIAISPVEIIRFVWQAARRHLLLSICTGLATLAIGLTVASIAPEWYQSEARILVEDSASKIDRPAPNSVNLISESTELILQRERVASIVEATDLLDNWEATRPPLLRFKDKLLSLISGGAKGSRSDKIDALAKMLAERVFVGRDKNIVSVQAQWRDPVLAERVARLTQKRLLESLETQEFSSRNATISILDDQAKRAAELIPAARDAVMTVRNHATDSSTIASSASSPPAATNRAPKIIVAPTIDPTRSEGDSTDQIESAAKAAAETRQADKKLVAKLSEIREKSWL